MTLLWITYIFSVFVLANSALDVPELSEFSCNSRTGRCFQSTVDVYPGQLRPSLNPAPNSSVSIQSDVQPNLLCVPSITVYGYIKCLLTRRDFRNRPVSTLQQLCEIIPDSLLTVTPSCDDQTGNATDDISVLFDEDLSTRWIYPAGSRITITIKFPILYQVRGLCWDLWAFPIAVDISYKSEDQYILITKLRLSCSEEEDLCIDMVFHSLSTGPHLCHLLSKSAGSVVTDSLQITFLPDTEHGDYIINYLLIGEIVVLSSCACADAGTCTAERRSISQILPYSYTCDCADNYQGFYCEQCGQDAFSVNGTSCTVCACGYGKLGENCTDTGVCDCNQELAPNTALVGPKCQTPYVDSVYPTGSNAAERAVVTIKGGLLTLIEIDENICTPESCVAGNCTEPDVERRCRMAVGDENSSVILFQAVSSLSGSPTNFTFSYSLSPSITEAIKSEPLKLFATSQFRSSDLEIEVANIPSDSKTQLVLSFPCDGVQEETTLQTDCKLQSDALLACTRPVLCNHTSSCPSGRSPTLELVCEESAVERGALWHAEQVVVVNASLSIDGLLELPLPYQFTFVRTPQINPWNDFLYNTQLGDAYFTINGYSLDSATSDEYIVTITLDGGTKLTPEILSITGNNMTVEIPLGVADGQVEVEISGILDVFIGRITIEQPITDRLGDNQLNLGLGLGLGLALPALIIALVAALVFIRSKRRRQAKKLEVTKKNMAVRYVSSVGMTEEGMISRNLLISEKPMVQINSALLERIKHCTIPRERVVMSGLLGQGQFGKVFKGQVRVDDTKFLTVAAKTLKVTDVTEDSLNQFLQEAVVMVDFNHPNVLPLIGVVVEPDVMPIVLLPFMAHGDLKSLLIMDEKAITLGDMLQFSLQVARGMEYLADKRFIHRDLAARNCMVDNNYMVKVADFGLSRDIYQSDYYQIDGLARPLPVKWMALESLISGRFTVQTDVWSFGVLMWEMFTRGASPYPGVLNIDVKSHLANGSRLDQPEHCPDQVFDVMLACWDADPVERIKFEEIVHILSDLLGLKMAGPQGRTVNIDNDYYLQTTEKPDSNIYVNLAK